jgi:C4-dicarboxylate-specific signal transduction histidine kinase
VLRDTFGHLVGTLDRAFTQISNLTAGLERTVGERTAELRQANAELARARDELEERVRERTAQLEQSHRQLLHAEKLSAVGRLSASIAHEFNNPIFAIRSVLQSVEQLGILPEEETESVSLSIAECDRVAALIRNLQSFNRPSQEVPGPVDLHHALDAILLLCRKELSAKNARIEKAYAGRPPVVWGVEDQLKQVFLNLLTNAMDALPAEGGSIRISTEAEAGTVAVRFADTGSGIPAEDLPRLFEPFFTTKPEVKGTGLGLSISYGIVHSHGGTIEVETRLGEGSTFTVRLLVEGVRK